MVTSSASLSWSDRSSGELNGHQESTRQLLPTQRQRRCSRRSTLTDCSSHPYCKVDAILLKSVSSTASTETVLRRARGELPEKSRIRGEPGVFNFQAGQTAHVRVCHRHASARRSIHRDISVSPNLPSFAPSLIVVLRTTVLYNWEGRMVWFDGACHGLLSQDTSEPARCPRSSTGVSS